MDTSMDTSYEAKDAWDSKLDYMLDDLQRTISPKPGKYQIVTQRTKTSSEYANSDRDSVDEGTRLLSSGPAGSASEVRIYKQWSSEGSKPNKTSIITSDDSSDLESLLKASGTSSEQRMYTQVHTTKSGSSTEMPLIKYGGIGPELDDFLRKADTGASGTVSTIQGGLERGNETNSSNGRREYRYEFQSSSSKHGTADGDAAFRDSQQTQPAITTRYEFQSSSSKHGNADGDAAFRDLQQIQPPIPTNMVGQNGGIQFSETRRQQQRTVVKTYQYEQQFTTSGASGNSGLRHEESSTGGKAIEYNTQPIPVRRLAKPKESELDQELDIRAYISEDESSTMRKSSKQRASPSRLEGPIEGQLCNIESHPDFPRFSRTKMAQDVEPLCTIPYHPRPMCNVEFHSGYPIFKISCPNQDEPFCNIEGPGHPKVMCNIRSHPEFPRFRDGTEKENRSVCTVPNHPFVFCNLPDHPNYPKNVRPGSENEEPFCNMEDHPTIKCNIPGHPSYPDFMPLGESQTEPICNVTGHPTGRCNVKFHPDYPRLVGDNGTNTAPFCFIPSHPELLCNIHGHPEYPGYMTETDALKDPYCNVPGHPEGGRCNVPTHKDYPKFFSGPATPYSCTLPSHPPIVCNVPSHPNYPRFTADTGPGTDHICNIPNHPQGECNIQGHPEFPKNMGSLGSFPPVCSMPNHPNILCNVPLHPGFPKFSKGLAPGANPFCNIPMHPKKMQFNCNVPEHPDFPIYIPDDNDINSPPVCDIPDHPELLCNVPKHPEYPKFSPGPPMDGEYICNIPMHPIMECNIPYHPEYPGRLGTLSTIAPPKCTIPAHPSLQCNIPKHPEYPNHTDGLNPNGPPVCNIPGHPELLCNVPHHPDFPRLAAKTPHEPFCNVPSHPLTTRPRLYKPGSGSPLPSRRTGSPEPRNQEPPKKLDDLLASLSPSPLPYTSTPAPSPTPPQEARLEPLQAKPVDAPKKKLKEQPSSPGAPVYYPQGDLFTGKEKPVSGNTLRKRKPKKDPLDIDDPRGGAAIIPVCLPVCCAMPCVIL